VVPVGYLRLTARTDDDARLHDFYIGVTNVSPWNTPPKLAEGNICKFFAGLAPSHYAVDIFCEPNTEPGRYVFLYFSRADYLALCEVEVYYK